MVKKQGIVRRAKACNTCRRKKTKCDGKRPICSSCHAFKLSCSFQDTVQYPTRPSRAYVEELERRLESMEQQLQQPKEPSIHGSDSESVDHDSEHSQSEGVMDQASYVINAQDGRMRFFGPSSGFAFASQQGAHWPTGGSRISIWHSAVQRSASRWQLGTWFPRPLQDDLQRRVFQPLPENRVVRQLVTEFFSTFNQAIPLFNESSFARALDRQFSWSPDESSSWWASLNVVLAFAYAQRAQESDNAPEWQLSLGHIKNTLNVIVDLFMRTADLFAVQAMLGLAIYFQGTPNPQSLFMFAAAAMRLSQSIGLHRAHALRMTTHQTEERRRTYWLAFILDADISLRVGRPPVQDSNDYDTPLPAEEPVDGKGILIVDSTPVNFFRLLVQFALIQRRVYHHLYTSAVQNKTRDSIVAEVKACEDALLDWKHAIPTNLQPQSTFSTATAYPMYHLLRLHLTFHCCYGNLYQVGMHAGRPASILSARNIPPVEDEIAQTMVASLESARSAVRLIKYIKRFGSAHQWNMLYFPAAASATLALGIFVHPDHEQASSDLSLLHETVRFLSTISSREPGTYVDYVLSLCSEFENAAKRILRQCRRQETGMQGVSMDNAHGEPVAPINVDATDPQREDIIDSTLDWQWSIPPFWNWQDLMASIPGSPLHMDWDVSLDI